MILGSSSSWFHTFPLHPQSLDIVLSIKYWLLKCGTEKIQINLSRSEFRSTFNIGSWCIYGLFMLEYNCSLYSYSFVWLSHKIENWRNIENIIINWLISIITTFSNTSTLTSIYWHTETFFFINCYIFYLNS